MRRRQAASNADTRPCTEDPKPGHKENTSANMSGFESAHEVTTSANTSADGATTDTQARHRQYTHGFLKVQVRTIQKSWHLTILAICLPPSPGVHAHEHHRNHLFQRPKLLSSRLRKKHS